MSLWLWELGELALTVGALFVALRIGAQVWRPGWVEPLTRRRIVIVMVLALAAVAVKITEDVVGRETGPIDEAILWAIRSHSSPRMTVFFEAFTWSGSSIVLVPLACVAALVLHLSRHRSEALQLAGTALAVPVVVYVFKAAIGRERPALWESPAYWGSSFPSGHTLAVSAIATAVALCIGRLWPAWRHAALAVAVTWIALVALSRMVLGVHWPTDVLTAACVGMLMPLVARLAVDLQAPR